MEGLVLANAIADRKSYLVAKATGGDLHLSDQGRALWSLIEEWYERDPDSLSVNSVLLCERAVQAHPRHADTFRELISDLDGKACPGNFTEILLEQRRDVLREQMSVNLMERNDQAFRELLGEYDGLDMDFTEDQESYSGTEPEALYEAVVDGVVTPLAGDQTNEILAGGPLRGQHCVIFALPEAGKSLFAINSLRTSAGVGLKVGMVENEDNIKLTQMRTAMSILGVTQDQLRNPTSRMKRRLEAAGWYDRIHFKHCPDGGSLAEVQRWVEEKNLDLCVINQIANLKRKSTENETQGLGVLAQGVRAIGKRTECTMLSVHQAGDSASGKLRLGMGDMYFSNTAIQATCDILIGMGYNDEADARGFRVLTFCKNKRTGDHSSYRVRVDKTTQRIE